MADGPPTSDSVSQAPSSAPVSTTAQHVGRQVPVSSAAPSFVPTTVNPIFPVQGRGGPHGLGYGVMVPGVPSPVPMQVPGYPGVPPPGMAPVPMQVPGYPGVPAPVPMQVPVSSELSIIESSPTPLFVVCEFCSEPNETRVELRGCLPCKKFPIHLCSKCGQELYYSPPADGQPGFGMVAGGFM